ncbi:MAG TPA: flagellar biosynthetic protein FliR [bacterium]|nr:flagellar biosynthetic protein FliR [bacterium]
MDLILNQSLNEFGKLLLIMCRVGGLLVFAPVLGSPDVSRQVKAALILLISLLLAASTTNLATPDITTWLFYTLIPKELTMGAMLGFAAGLIFAAVQYSGSMIGLEIGFRFGTLIDPQADEEVSLVAQFQYLLASLIFVIMGGHRWVLSGLADSFQLVPPGAVRFMPGVEMQLLSMAATIFVTAVQISAPVLLSLLLSSFVLGILSRTVPQLNIINVGFILKILFGLFFMLVTMDYFGEFMVYLFNSYRRDVLVLWRLFS